MKKANRFKKILALVIAILLALLLVVIGILEGGFVAPRSSSPEEEYQENGEGFDDTEGETPEQGVYPIHWDLTELYADVDAWKADYAKAEAMTYAFADYEGTLHSAEGIYNYFSARYDGEYPNLVARLDTYAILGKSLDGTDPVFLELDAQISKLDTLIETVTAYVDPEIFSLPLEERERIFSDPMLAEYRYAARSYTDPEQVHYSTETQTALATLRSGMNKVEDIAQVLRDIELQDRTFTMPDGSVVILDEDKFYEIYYGEYDDNLKQQALEVYVGRAEPYQNTFAGLLNAQISENWAEAQLDKKASTREWAMEKTDVDPIVYDLLLDTVHEMLPEYQKFEQLHQQTIQLIQNDLSTLFRIYDSFEYDEGIDMVRQALSVLGDDYIAAYDSLVTSAHQDVYPTDTKETGGFSVSESTDFAPYILWNFTGDEDDVSTIAHEMGHSIYTLFSQQNQSYINAFPGIFTQEVASVTNEFLYYNMRKNEAETPMLKLYYMDCILSLFTDTLFTQAEFAEFEDYLYQVVEGGGALSADALNDKWLELVFVYDGDLGIMGEAQKTNWTQIPHLFYCYYVYKYATSTCYAADISSRILSGDSAAVENYKAFLKRGGSASPADLLSTAGVDPNSSETYRQTVNYYHSLVEEYAQLVEELSREQAQEQGKEN